MRRTPPTGKRKPRPRFHTEALFRAETKLTGASQYIHIYCRRVNLNCQRYPKDPALGLGMNKGNEGDSPSGCHRRITSISQESHLLSWRRNLLEVPFGKVAAV